MYVCIIILAINILTLLVFYLSPSPVLTTPLIFNSPSPLSIVNKTLIYEKVYTDIGACDVLRLNNLPSLPKLSRALSLHLSPYVS